MNRKRCFLTVGAGLAFLIAFGCASFADNTATSSDIAFTFAPPSGLSFIEKQKTVQTTTGGGMPKMVYTMVNNKKVQITKTDTGYTLVSTPMEVEARFNNRPLPPDMLLTEKVVARQAVHTCSIDDTGRLLAIDGLDTFFKQLKDVVALKYPQGAKRLSDMEPVLKLGVETSIKDDWLDRVTAYTGKTAKIGELWKSQEKMPAYSGNLTVNMRTRFVERVSKGGHDCVLLRFHYATDPNAVKAEIKDAFNDVMTMMNLPSSIKLPKIVAAELSGDGERVIDPETMLVYSETQTLSFTMVMDIPGMGRKGYTTDSKEDYSYEYQQPSN